VRHEEAEAIYGAGREAVVDALVSAWAALEDLTVTVDALRERVDELERQLNRSSKNSSMPPSSDAPMTRQQRRAQAGELAKKLSQRKPGGQPGHEGNSREMAGAERVDERFEHFPRSCAGCGQGFGGDEERLGDPVIHQKWELPPISP
jgi:transposase